MQNNHAKLLQNVYHTGEFSALGTARKIDMHVRTTHIGIMQNTWELYYGALHLQRHLWMYFYNILGALHHGNKKDYDACHDNSQM